MITAGFIFDDDNGEMGEWIVKREKFNWLIEALQEYMPMRSHSEFLWAEEDGEDITEEVQNVLSQNIK